MVEVALQTLAPENLRYCRCGDERPRQAFAEGVRGPPSAQLEIYAKQYNFILQPLCFDNLIMREGFQLS